jgi:hypothetical protein
VGLPGKILIGTDKKVDTFYYFTADFMSAQHFLKENVALSLFVQLAGAEFFKNAFHLWQITAECHKQLETL